MNTKVNRTTCNRNNDSAECRIKAAQKLFDSAVAKLERTFPDLQSKVLFWTLELGLRELKTYLEDSSSGVSWDSPFAQIHYPVEIDWQTWTTPPMTVRIITGHFHRQNTRNKREINKAVLRALTVHFTALTLQHLTRYLSIEKRGKQAVPILTEELAGAYMALRSPNDREQFLTEVLRPFSWGAGEVEVLPGGEVLSEKQMRSAAAIDIPPIWIPFEKDGHQLRFTPILRIHPLTVDVKRKLAYHPITVGLAILPRETKDTTAFIYETGAPWVSPANWSNQEREKLWEWAFSFARGGGTEAKKKTSKKAIKKRDLEKRLLGELPKLQKVYEVVGPVTDASEVNAEARNILREFHKHGGKLKIAWDSNRSAEPENAKMLHSLIRQVDMAKSAESKGKSLEGLIVRMLESVPGFRCTSRKQTTTEEIDIVVSNEATDPWLSRMKPVVLVECKNWQGRCTKSDLVCFERKIENRRGQCDLGFFVAWNGFSDKFQMEALRSSQSSYVVVCLDKCLIKKAVGAGALYQMLHEAYLNAVTI